MFNCLEEQDLNWITSIRMPSYLANNRNLNIITAIRPVIIL